MRILIVATAATSLYCGQSKLSLPSSSHIHQQQCGHLDLQNWSVPRAKRPHTSRSVAALSISNPCLSGAMKCVLPFRKRRTTQKKARHTKLCCGGSSLSTCRMLQNPTRTSARSIPLSAQAYTKTSTAHCVAVVRSQLPTRTLTHTRNKASQKQSPALTPTHLRNKARPSLLLISETKPNPHSYSYRNNAQPSLLLILERKPDPHLRNKGQRSATAC